MKIPQKLYQKKYRRLITVTFSIGAIFLECSACTFILYYFQKNAGNLSLFLALILHAMTSLLIVILSIFARFSVTDSLIVLLKEKQTWEPVVDRLINISNEMFVSDKSFKATVEKNIVIHLDNLDDNDKETYLESKNMVMKYVMHSYPPDEVQDIRRLRYFSHITGWISFFMPVIGLSGCFCVYFSITSFIASKGLAEDYQEETARVVDDEPLPDTVKNHEAFMSNELNVEPIRDILSGDDPDMKRGAVDYLGRIGTPEAVRILKQCLADDSPEVRFMSHTMLGRIDEKHVNRIKKLQHDLEKASIEDHAILHEKLGYCYKAYSDSQLLEVSTRDYYLKQSEDSYQANLSLTNSNDPNILFTLAQIYTMLNETENAKSYFEMARISALKKDAFMLALRCIIGHSELLFQESLHSELVASVKKMPNAIEQGYHQYKKLHQENPKNIIIRKLLFQFTFLSNRKEEAHLLQETFQEDDPLKDAHIGIISFWLDKIDISSPPID
jgi:tetratricopeptide (TPR) repeat protein